MFLRAEEHDRRRCRYPWRRSYSVNRSTTANSTNDTEFHSNPYHSQSNWWQQPLLTAFKQQY